MNKMRLDQYLYSKGFTESREQAKRIVMAGKVTVNGRIANKGSLMVEDQDSITVKPDNAFVSRGGKKLARAFEVFNFNVKNRIMMDVGASTGGFTDCLLQHEAAKVYSIDVGYGQLHWKLRNDPRVVVMERTNARYLTPENLNEFAQGAVADVAFISLTKILPAIERCTTDDSFFIGLIKPQFEAGRDKVGKRGVVRDKATHIEVIERICAFINEGTAFNVCDINHSPITGPNGNIEYLVHCDKTKEAITLDAVSLVDRAHAALLK